MHINTKIITRIALVLFLCLGLSTISRSQILISLLLGDKLNSGQIEFGLTGGYSRSQIFQEPRVKHLNVFYLGFYFDFLLKKNWYLYTGVHVKARMGASDIPVYSLEDAEMDSVFVGGSIDRKISYFNVPIEIKYRFKNNIYVDAGFQLGLRYRAFDEFINTINTRDDLTYK
ncbi:MAG: outer membrane beta-barrel protein, partial [Bacteroidota bacterium]|nr:outer membrane beta-barrel protein [Bacteroidota bacterium]